MALLNPIKAIAFDLDGTLVDSLPGLAAAMDDALEECGLPRAGEDHVRLWIGNGADMLAERALIWAGETVTETSRYTLRNAFDRHYEKHVDAGSKLFPNVLETLSSLRQRGFQLAIVTNKPSQFVPALLTHLKLDHYFDLIVGGDDVIIKKPHPAPLFLVMAKLGLYQNELLFVGDSRNDIQAAQAAGCQSVGFTFGYNYGEDILLSEPTVVLHHFDDLLSVII